MIYLVTGLHRTGTSMMTRALAVSSILTPIISMEIEERIRSRQIDPEYDPNPHGYWQAPEVDLSTIPAESLAKLLPMRLLDPPRRSDGYNVIIMNRKLSNANASYRQAFGLDRSKLEIDLLDRAKAALIHHHDVKVQIVDYEAVVKNPIVAFKKLILAGWPIDLKLAENTIDQKLHRHRDV